MKQLIAIFISLIPASAFSALIENVHINRATVQDSFESCIYGEFQSQMLQRTGYALFSTLTFGPDFRYVETAGELEIDYTRSRFYLNGKEMPANTIVRYYLDFETSDRSAWKVKYTSPSEAEVAEMRSKLMSSAAIVSKETGLYEEIELFRFEIEKCKDVLTE